MFTARLGRSSEPAIPRRDRPGLGRDGRPIPVVDSHPSPRPCGLPQRPMARRLRVLLVEDQPINRIVAVRMLERLGHSSTVAADGCEALVHIAAEPFDVVLMDVQMPGMDGLEAVAALRALERGTGRHLTTVALTAHAMKGDRERFLAAGFDDYLSKPIRPDELREALDRLALCPVG